MEVVEENLVENDAGTEPESERKKTFNIQQKWQICVECALESNSNGYNLANRSVEIIAQKFSCSMRTIRRIFQEFLDKRSAEPESAKIDLSPQQGEITNFNRQSVFVFVREKRTVSEG